MHQNFATCTKWLLTHEGGFVNHPRDPGGATNRGVTQRVFDGYLDRIGEPRRSVRNIKEKEVWAIYKCQYWDRVFGDALPPGLDYAMYDYAVHSGVARAVGDLQELVGVEVDGVMGNVTLGAIRQKNDLSSLIQQLCLKRFAFVQRLKTWDTFGRGWTRRIMGDHSGVQAGSDHGVIDRAVWLYQGREDIQGPNSPAAGKADGHDLKNSAKVKDSLSTDNLAKIGAGAVPGAITAASSLPEGPLQWAFAAIAVLGAVMVALLILKKSGVLSSIVK